MSVSVFDYCDSCCILRDQVSFSLMYERLLQLSDCVYLLVQIRATDSRIEYRATYLSPLMAYEYKLARICGVEAMEIFLRKWWPTSFP